MRFLDSAHQNCHKSAQKNLDNKFVVDQCYQFLYFMVTCL